MTRKLTVALATVAFLIFASLSNGFFWSGATQKGFFKSPHSSLSAPLRTKMSTESPPMIVADFAVSTVMQQLGGKIVVSGIGSRDDDEFLLNLLNEQVFIKNMIEIYKLQNDQLVHLKNTSEFYRRYGVQLCWLPLTLPPPKNDFYRGLHDTQDY